MKRRSLISYTTVAATTALALPAFSQTKFPQIKWKMTTSWPKTLNTLFGGAEKICDRVAALTNGRFTITPYQAGEIVGGLEVLDSVQQGTIECGHTCSSYYKGKNSALVFATSVPFGLTAQQQNGWLYHGGGLEAIQKVYTDFNVINFPAGNTGAQMGGWFRQEINTLADLNGLKMRIPGLGGDVMSKLGVNVQVLPSGEIYLALERGVIDAAELSGPYDDHKLGLYKAAKYYYYPGWWEPGPTIDILVNLDAWNKLPKEYQEIFQTAAYETNLNMLAQYDALNSKALLKLMAKDVQFKTFSPEIMEAAQKATFDICEENASQDESFKEVYQQWKKFREQVFNWNKFNELSFAQFSFNNSSS
ncbi:TRAP dicarboxylate transporter- DctP subunit [Trichodesmium erythraeum IMS101]|uniref:TRAP dicarboxylate transporter-DctP subunit n=1 Tax=Trichodesmium erythraeum (strain IMS101) TaxID=203124 RepID=Q10WG4_TRIEI|nr:TRAP transporter substrate-binding protein [Trichodesmium erythraeum GBRTRLIN201]MCH2051294.1 TRAP transporter substrate-binding protein [Trichodesmium sp. ALOHA_ZT_67]MDE5093037.1 TRAP transporter substrate-binding protein [Trichodesmium sp. St11_bin5]MDT9342108.1 TRAP transporter substrate-binding protein [Trichodesmium erythraeum 21-75]